MRRRHTRLRGARLYCSGVTTPLAGETFHGYAKILRDLTDRKGTEALEQRKMSLERSVRAKVEAASRLKDEFLAVLSHELKNPLNLIHVKADMLDRAPSTQNLPVVRDAADAIRRSVISLAKIIDDLLDLSRVRTGKLTLERSRIDIAAITATVAGAIETDSRAHQVSVSVSGMSEPFSIEADAVRYEQILWNLLSNAVKFTPAGGRTDRRSVSRDDGFACIEVADTGRGIEPAFLPHVFDMFSQAEGAHRRQRGGLGIGLALVKQLTEMHGGHVKAESQGRGKGARFRVWLPADNAPPDAGNQETPGDVSLLNGMRILLVDDATESLQAFRSLLELEGAQTSGKGALDAASKQPFDLVLSDIGMPDMDGYELIAALRKLPAMESVPALALTGFGRPQDVTRAIRAGCDGHLSKPASLQALLDRIAAITARPVTAPLSAKLAACVRARCAICAIPFAASRCRSLLPSARRCPRAARPRQHDRYLRIGQVRGERGHRLRGPYAPFPSQHPDDRIDQMEDRFAQNTGINYTLDDRFNQISDRFNHRPRSNWRLAWPKST